MKMKTIIITGAASGIGKAVAELFYSEGWQLGLLDLNPTPLQDTVKDWDKSRYCIVAANVTDPDQVETALQQIMQSIRLPDVLFNCAGVLEVGDFEAITLDRHHRILDINNKGVLNCCYFAFPYLKQNPGSRVINMSSASSLYGIPGFASYSASKFWVKGFTEALNLEWARYGIQVMDIEPPFVNTPMLANKQAQIIRRLGVKLVAEDIAVQVFQAAQGERLHNAVSREYKVLRAARKWLPDRAAHKLVKWMSGY